MKKIKKTLSLLLVTVVICASFFTLSTPASAASRSQAEAVAWVNSKIGVGLDYDGAYGNQCVDLIFYYYNYLGASLPSGDNNACNFIDNTLPSGWTRISSNIVPQPGDIAVWKTNHSCGTCITYWAGHIGIVVSGNSSTFTAVNQNFGGATYCTKNEFNTSALACVIRPNFSGTSANITISWSDYADKHWIGSTNAILARRCDLNMDVSAMTKVGIYLYDYKGTELKSKSENISFSGFNYMTMWYDVNGELGYTLAAGTPYKYKFMAVVNGKTYYSPVYSFTTTGTHSHKYNSGAVTKNPGCASTGTRTYTCTTCGKTKTESISATGHSYGSWSTTKGATCTTTGTQKRTCTKCSAYETKNINALGHNYSSSWTVDKGATCTVAGSKSHHCTRCSAKKDVTSISPTGHSFGSWTTTKSATCTLTGTRKRTCSKCGSNETNTIAALGHNYSSTWTIDKVATCTEAGSKSHHCSRCTSKADVTPITATGHSWGAWKVSVAATTERTGTDIRKCTNSGCKVTEKRTVSKLSETQHTHSFGEWTVEIEATCKNEGVMVSECSVCSQKQTRTIAKTVHSFGAWKIIENASDETIVLEERRCEVCFETEQRSSLSSSEVNSSTESLDNSSITDSTDTNTNANDSVATENDVEIDERNDSRTITVVIIAIALVIVLSVVVVLISLYIKKKKY